MPGQDQYVALPDGTYIHVPGDATPDQLSQLKTKLSAQNDPLRTGAGMEAAAHEQARVTPAQAAAKMQPNNAALMLANSPSGADPHNAANPNWNALPESERLPTAQRLAPVAGLLAGGMPTVAEIAATSSLRPLIPLARAYVGSKLGGYAGRDIGGMVGHPEAGETVGKVAGGIAGGMGVKIPNWRNSLLESVLGSGEKEAAGLPTVKTPPITAPPEPYVAQGPPEPYMPQGPAAPLPTVRRVPGDIAPEQVSSGAEPRMPTVSGPGNQVLAGGGGQIVRPQMALPPAPESAPAELPTVKPKSFNWNMNRLRDLVESEGAGTPPPLKRNVPLGDQLFTPPKAPPTEMPSVGQKVSDVINQNTEQEAVRPLSAGPQKSTPLRQIAAEGPPAEPVTHRATVTHEGKTFGMEAANGRKMYDATAHDTELARDVHLLSTKDATKGPTVQNAFMNLGGDVNQVGLEGQRFKAAVKGPTERVQMFDWLLDHGHTPEEIIAAAKKTPGAK